MRFPLLAALLFLPGGLFADDLIRTPPAPETPRINGPRVFGARPGHPFLYHLPTTGRRPITYSAAGLPDGLTLDASTGNITGVAGDRGDHPVVFTASNALGKSSATIDFIIGDQIALTPPMGFNSWNFFARNITEGKMRAAADAMVSSGLVDHGWTYVNIDDCWQGKRDAAGNIQGNENFPDLKELSDYIHARGLKFGLYSSPGPSTCTGFAASYRHEDQDAKTYAAWGVDYVKYDLCSYGGIIGWHKAQFLQSQIPPAKAAEYAAATGERDRIYHVRENQRTPEQKARLEVLNGQVKTLAALADAAKIKRFDLSEQRHPYEVFGRALAAAPRDIVYSLCQYGNADVWEWGAALGANSWRTTGDISANWGRMTEIGFSQDRLASFAGPGHWNDPDMLEIGNRGLSPDECYTHMTLWCMLSAPLLIGCDMSSMSPLTVSMFSNDEVLAVDQDALGRQGTLLRRNGKREIWTKPLADGTTAAAFFNRDQTPAQMGLEWAELKQTGEQPARDLWRQKDLPVSALGVNISVAPHSAELLRIGRPR